MLLYFASQGFDDNAKFRQKAVFDQEDTTESDPREVEAASHNLNYVQVGVHILAIYFVF